MEELRIYLDLVAERGDPFTIFDRDGPADEAPDVPGRHSQDMETDPALARVNPSVSTTWF